MEPALQQTWGWYAPSLLAIGAALLLIILVVGYLLFRRKWLKPAAIPQSELQVEPELPLSLNELVDHAKLEKPGAPLDIILENGSYMVEGQVTLTSPTRLQGKGASQTKIVSEGNQPAIKVENTQNCALSNLQIKGTIQCNNSELTVENCHIIANADGIGIEAYDGSVVTISGLITSEGGIAIHAKGKSKVIIKTPYGISDEDYVVVDPKSKVTLQYQPTEPLPTSEKKPEENPT